MASDTLSPPLSWWKLGRLEQVALILGAVVGLGAAAPLVWLSAEALRTGHTELTGASHLYPRALLAVWLASALVGGLLAAQLVRRASGGLAARREALSHVLGLVGGSLLIALVSPLPLALVAFAVTREPAVFKLYYVSTGGLVGWQPGVISFVFLYTFRALERRKNGNDCRLEAGAPTEGT